MIFPKIFKKRIFQDTPRWFFLGLFLCLYACQNQNPPQRFLFIGHGYQWVEAGDRMDYRLELIDFEQYDQIWLGGDICAKTSRTPGALEYLDSIFDLASPTVHWSLGNHDLPETGADLHPSQFTHRKTYYYSEHDSLGVLVLNTNLFIWPLSKPGGPTASAMEEQTQLVRQLGTHPPAISHLVVLHHRCLLTNQMAGGDLKMDTIFNDYKPMLKGRMEEEESTFENTFWPYFQQLQKAGIQVVFVGGDLGMQAKQFAYQTEEGVWFLGAGINNTVPEWHRPDYLRCFAPDQVLEFSYAPKTKTLTWEFIELNELVGVEGPIR